MRTIFTETRIGIHDKKGWLVRYGGRLVAVLTESEDGSVTLTAGLEHPFICVWQSWPSLAAAKEEFRAFCRVYAKGATPKQLTDFIEAYKQQADRLKQPCLQ
jgi:hypothetical protein